MICIEHVRVKGKNTKKPSCMERNNLPRLGEIVTIFTEMRNAAKNSQFLKRLALLFSAVLFLGSFEVSAYSGSANSTLALHKQDCAQPFDVTDELFTESGEERDGESVTDTIFTTELIRLPKVRLVDEKISAIVLVPESLLLSSPKNSRAPPAL